IVPVEQNAVTQPVDAIHELAIQYLVTLLVTFKAAFDNLVDCLHDPCRQFAVTSVYIHANHPLSSLLCRVKFNAVVNILPQPEYQSLGWNRLTAHPALQPPGQHVITKQHARIPDAGDYKLLPDV